MEIEGAVPILQIIRFVTICHTYGDLSPNAPPTPSGTFYTNLYIVLRT